MKRPSKAHAILVERGATLHKAAIDNQRIIKVIFLAIYLYTQTSIKGGAAMRTSVLMVIISILLLGESLTSARAAISSNGTVQQDRIQASGGLNRSFETAWTPFLYEPGDGFGTSYNTEHYPGRIFFSQRSSEGSPVGVRERFELAFESLSTPVALVEFLDGTPLNMDDQALMHAIQNLPETLRQPLLLRFYYDLSYSEIANRLGLSEATVRKRIQLARDILRR